MNELKKNDLYEAEIEGYSSEAMGVCRIGGRAVFVPGTLKGERWRIRILKVAANAVYARPETLLMPSPERRDPECPHYGRCGGCDCRHMSYEEELRFKLGRVNDALRRIGKQTVSVSEIVGCERIEGYRNKAIFAVSEQEGRPVYGFYRPRSHQLVPVGRCLLQTELSCRTADTLCCFMGSQHIPAYDEQSGRGLVRHVFCRQSVHGRDAVACIVAAGGFGAKTGDLVAELRRNCPELTGIVLNVNKSRGNTVLAGEFYPLWGKAEVRDSLLDLWFEVSPRAFFQINPPQAEKLYRKAVSYAVETPEDLVLDLYCGAGTISLCLAREAAKVIGTEIVPEAVENARSNAAQNGISNAEFLCADAGQAAAMLAERGVMPDAVVVDPPRRGMDESAISAIASMGPGRVVYVSCDPATLARDVLRFQAQGYALEQAAAVDMFPRTAHVEVVCQLVHT